MTEANLPGPNSRPVPVVCTLSDGQLVHRTLEWSDLASLALSVESLENGVASTYPLALADRIEDLARREASCCGTWLSSQITRLDDAVRLELTTANPEGLGLIRQLAGVPSAK